MSKHDERGRSGGHTDRGRSTGHKDRQVCRQVFEALSLALAELDEPSLADLTVASVDPAPDASRVVVTLVVDHADVDVDAARAALAELMPELRAEVAAELTRRRVPELVFRLAPPGPGEPR